MLVADNGTDSDVYKTKGRQLVSLN